MSGATMLHLLGWIIDATVKGSVVILLVLLTQMVIGRQLGARWRHVLWLLVLLRLAIPLAPSARWSVFTLLPRDAGVAFPLRVAADRTLMPPAGYSTSSEVVNLLDASAPAGAWRWILAVWLCGAAVLALRSLVAALRVQTAVRRACHGAVSRRLVDAVDEARRRLGVRRTVRVAECDFVDAPALHGLFRPVMLVPAGFSDVFDRDELRHVALHELWHLRRFDVAVNWALAVVEALHWFNPLVWFAVSRIREERELACDERTLSCLEEDERLGYGRTIFKLLERFRAATPIPAFVGIVNHKQQMKRRLLMIASYRNRTRFSIAFVATLALIGLVGMTDPPAGRRTVLNEKLDPAAAQTMEKLRHRVTLDLTGASLGEMLAAVSNATGVTIAQSPGAAVSAAQQARFTIHAENVPAHALLRAALMPLHLFPKTLADGVTVFQVISPEGEVVDKADGKSMTFTEEQEHIVVRDRAVDAASPGEQKKITITIDGAKEPAVTADGTLHRTFKFNMEENGVKSQGTLAIDITGVPASTGAPAAK